MIAVSIIEIYSTMIRTDKAAAIERCSANIAAVLRHYGLPEVTVIAARPDRRCSRGILATYVLHHEDQ